MTAPVYACARCGEKPRDGDTFLCADCWVDPDRDDEQSAVSDLPSSTQRSALIASGWAGWHRRMKAASRA